MSCTDCYTKINDYSTDNLFTWCSNCGNYGINAAIKRTLAEMEIKPKDIMLFFDIGCNGNGADKIGGYRFHGLHGRVIPASSGASLANRNLKVIASGGDGATLGEGVNHLIHAIRSNYDITFILHNNSNYGLTQGQASSTTKQNVPMNISPEGIIENTINPLQLVLSLNPSFVARTFSGDIHQMTDVFKAGIEHKGFSFIEVLQYCPTYNKATPHEWYQDRVYNVVSKDGYDNSNIEHARAACVDLESNIATGILYQDSNSVDFYSRLQNRKSMTTQLVDEVYSHDISGLLERFR